MPTTPVEFVTLPEIENAATRLASVAVRTPLVPFPRLTPAVWIKPESLQPTGAFKLRGAYNAIVADIERAREHGVVAHSSGNHGHAVAYAAAQLGVHAVVVVPQNAPKLKTDAITYYGAELVSVKPTLEARVTTMNELAAAHGYVKVPPFDDRGVIAGQGTIGLEIVADCAADDPVVVVPVSGGGLISGIAAAVKRLRPQATVIGVEPELAADARDSLLRGERVAWPASDVQRTIADALRVEEIGELNFAHIREFVSGFVTVTEQQMLTAIARLAREARLVAEPGGAAAVAACLFRDNELPADRPRVAVLSGGNIDPALLARVLAMD
ncbi:MAG TPA: threonine/serine dehydratase [Streptosporangiaceae bacterium]|jgi:threonine dehydratase